MNIKRKSNIFLIATVFVAVLFFSNSNAKADSCGTQRSGDACVTNDGASGSCSAAKVCVAVDTGACGSRSIIGDGCTMNDGSRGTCNRNAAGSLSCYFVDNSTNSNNNTNPPTTPSKVCGPTEFCNPLSFSNVEGFLGGILSAIQKIIVVLALVFIMIGAVMILTSAGNSGMVEQGKGAITMALVGLALGVAAPSLLKELSIIIGWGPGSGGTALTLSQIAVNVLNFLLGTMGIVALVMLVIGAIMYLTSAGDEDRIDKGKEIFKYSLIGVVLAMSSMVLVTQIAKFFQ